MYAKLGQIPFFTLAAALFRAFLKHKADSGPWPALARLTRSVRTLRSPLATYQALAQVARVRPQLQQDIGNHFFFAQHRGYLSGRFSVRQRIESVRHHYEFLDRAHRPSYLREVYGENGLTLWRHIDGNDEFRIALGPNLGIQWEGDLSAFIYANDVCLGMMSFAFVPRSVVGLSGPGTVMFIARNQSHGEALQKAAFSRAFKRTTPQYLCLAALTGVAAAYGMRELVAVSHRAQVAYSRSYERSFVNAYDNFWSAFGSAQLGCGSYLMSVPFKVVPLAQVKSKHRRRAQHRRDIWSQVEAAARASTTAQCSTPGPAAANADTAVYDESVPLRQRQMA